MSSKMKILPMFFLIHATIVIHVNSIIEARLNWTKGKDSQNWFDSSVENQSWRFLHSPHGETIRSNYFVGTINDFCLPLGPMEG